MNINFPINIGWSSKATSTPPDILEYSGTNYGCNSPDVGICYWTSLEVAQRYCQMWSDCEGLYETDQVPPATTGSPIFWAMKGIGSSYGYEGGVHWTMKNTGTFVFKIFELKVLRLYF